ncbi:deoxyribodipyrimidine photo-lyase [Candidatus Dependentiae bacterium]|nr:deoxyribodipyrimidine photo-lyase [Candidatus Dependentiae bacterium]
MKNPVIVWFRQDLRVHDNLALVKAAEYKNIIPIYIFDGSIKDPQMGKASCWWLHHSLQKLNEKVDSKLSVYKGNSLRILKQLVKKHGVTKIFAGTCYEPGRIEQDGQILAELAAAGVELEFVNNSLLWAPQDVLKDDGSMYKVFTPFYKNAITSAPLPRKPLSVPSSDFVKDSDSLTIDELELLDAKHPVSYAKFWQPGEDAAQKKLTAFIDAGLQEYSLNRDFADKDQTSHLSPHLHFGEISPNVIWHTMHSADVKKKASPEDREKFIAELCWREFSYTLLVGFPELPKKNFQKKFDAFAWKSDAKLLHAWQQGRTGFPMVDAGMRQLLQTGYMHNRVRMIVASFLTKNLMQFWGHGAAWFWEHLVDADLANNSASWQWVAGSGVDAAPFFRIFNPVTQGEKFDTLGEYVRKYVPELKKMPQKFLFNPWKASVIDLRGTGIVIGQTYPMPLVDVDESRKRALAAYEKLGKDR